MGTAPSGSEFPMPRGTVKKQSTTESYIIVTSVLVAIKDVVLPGAPDIGAPAADAITFAELVPTVSVEVEIVPVKVPCTAFHVEPCRVICEASSTVIVHTPPPLKPPVVASTPIFWPVVIPAVPPETVNWIAPPLLAAAVNVTNPPSAEANWPCSITPSESELQSDGAELVKLFPDAEIEPTHADGCQREVR